MIHVSIFQITSPLGELSAIATDEELLFLQFSDKKNLDSEIDKFIKKNDLEYTAKESLLKNKIQMEISEYFSGGRSNFSIDIELYGTEFQKTIWNEIVNIPYGQFISYKMIGNNINKPKALRAIGAANSQNKIAILIPCHRVVDHDGGVSGYSWGIERKKFLMNHEKKNNI